MLVSGSRPNALGIAQNGARFIRRRRIRERAIEACPDAPCADVTAIIDRHELGFGDPLRGVESSLIAAADIVASQISRVGTVICSRRSMIGVVGTRRCPSTRETPLVGFSGVGKRVERELHQDQFFRDADGS